MVKSTNEAAKVQLMTGLADALRQSMAHAHGGLWFCATSTMMGDAASSRTAPVALVLLARLRGTLHGELHIEIAKKDAELLWRQIGSPGHDWRAAWQQVWDGAVQHLPKREDDAGIFAFSVESHELREPGSDGVQIGRMELGLGDGAGVPLRVLADDELLESLRAGPRKPSAANARGKSNDGTAAEFNRVIDVPLMVTLRFGQRMMRLREVLELATGALVELDRQVEEPVDLILNERVIARGEVVIVDGNYGLRVTEIVERNPAMLL